MEKVTKVFFSPLLADRAAVTNFVKTLPVGSAHPFSGELLLNTEFGLETIDISNYNDDFFTNSISLGDIGEHVLSRMKLFPSISIFNEQYSIQQAPSATFQVPLEDGLIHIFAVSKRVPTYYDLCLAASNYRTTCYNAKGTFPGIKHSGDINSADTLLHHIVLTSDMDETPRTVFVSGYNHTKLWKYREHNPVVLVANHNTKVLYIVPIPLDTATIGEAVLCCPLVIKRSANNLICSILSSPTTDNDLMCSGSRLASTSFASAIQRAYFTLPESTSLPNIDAPEVETYGIPSSTDVTDDHSSTDNAEVDVELIFATNGVILPTILPQQNSQVIRFGKGLHWITGNAIMPSSSSVVLPSILGDTLEGPLLLATGEAPSGVPFTNINDLHRYYKRAKSVVVIVDEKMSDNARNLASSWRINGLFIIQRSGYLIEDLYDVGEVLDTVNINAVTALAGPQSLIVVQLGSRYYFYRGMADVKYCNTASLKFGQDVTEILTNLSVEKLFHPSWPRMVNLSRDNTIYMPITNNALKVDELKEIFRTSSLATLATFRDDIIMVVCQLQTLFSQERLQDLSAALVEFVEEKISTVLTPTRSQYTKFITQEYDIKNLESRKRKEKLLGDLRKLTKDVKDNVQWLIQTLGNVVSTQTTSTRTHDLNRLVRQTKIKSNVAAAKLLSFEKVSEMLEEHAEKMGVLIVNIDTEQYNECLSDAEQRRLNPVQLKVCELDSRIIHLEGLDAGLVLEQSQVSHQGPLASSLGRDKPIMAMSTLDSHHEQGSMLAWVCWDEFVNLEDPYSIRWVEKCNEPHISALRIIMRSTLSQAVSSRDLNLEPSSPATGQFMGVLLMSSMLKLAETRNSPVLQTSNPVDTTTLLMRGLFGNLLTIAGSGTKPLSFVWQLFGFLPQIDIPNTISDWYWYEAVAILINFTGWPLRQFQKNVFALLDKIIFRAMTRNENADTNQLLRKSMAEHCDARNIQLLHSRTIITTLQKMLTELDHDERQKSASRLLDLIPANVKYETRSYTRLHRYIIHLSSGGQIRKQDGLLAANIFTKRSGVFGKAKLLLSEAVRANEKDKAISICNQIFEERSRIEQQWGLEKDMIHIQCIEPIIEIFAIYNAGEEVPHLLARKIYGDNEQRRVPWHVGEGKPGLTEDLDEDTMNHILGVTTVTEQPSTANIDVRPPSRIIKKENQFDEFNESTNAAFLNAVQKANSLEDVCSILGIPKGAMKAFAKLLAPDFQLERISETFKALILRLLRDRNRDAATVKPTLQLFDLPLVDEK